MKYRIIILAAVIAMLCFFTACTGKKESVSLTIKAPIINIGWGDNSEIISSEEFMTNASKAFMEQYEDADVTIDVKCFSLTDEKTAVTDCFDTNSATDILFEDYFNMESYVHTGRVVPLDDIITEELKNDIDDTYWNMSMVDGKTYMMPYLSRQNILMYNKALMKDCGLGKYVSDDGQIQNWSTDQWTQILDTLAKKLPDNTYPMMMYASNNQGDTHIMSLLRAFGSDIFDENGNFDFESEEAVEALAWIQNGVDKGWFPTHCENLEITDNQELFDNNQLVFYVFNNANIPLYENLDNYGFVNFPNNVATAFSTGFEIFDNGDESKIKVAKDFLTYIYQTDEWLELSAGNIPASNKVAEKYADKIPMLGTFLQNSENVVDFMHNSPNWQGTDTSVRSVFYPHIHDLLMKTVTPEECAAALDEDCNNALETGRKNNLLHE
jgi:multiple sugar transport system substrate-binding protein